MQWLAKLALAAGFLFSAGLLASGGASAATCTVSGTGGGNQNVVYTVTPPPGGDCYAYGSGNINAGSNDEFLDLALADGLTGIAKTGEGSFGSQYWTTEPVNGDTSGTFELSAAALAGFTTLVVGLKSGTTWATFLVQAGVEYTWSIMRDGEGKELSHASLYAAVPVPAGLALLGSGLVALGLLRRRRVASAA